MALFISCPHTDPCLPPRRHTQKSLWGAPNMILSDVPSSAPAVSSAWSAPLSLLPRKLLLISVAQPEYCLLWEYFSDPQGHMVL